MSIALLSLKYVKDHIRLANQDSDEDIAAKIEIASSLVLQVLKLSAIPDAWYINSPVEIEAPEYEKGMCALFVAEMYFAREAGSTNLFSENMMNYIRLKREPTVE